MTVVLPILAIAWACQADSAPFVYVVQPLAGSVAVIDAATSTVTTTIPVGSTPASIAINRSGTVGYVANYGSNSVSVLDLTTNVVVSSIAVNGPSGIVINPAETRLYVSSGVNRTVSILDARSGSLVAVVPLADAPMGLAADPAGDRVYVLYALLGTIAVIDTATNAISTSLDNRPDLLPIGFAVAPTLPQLYVANSQFRSGFNPPSTLLTRIDTRGNAPVASIDVGDQVSDVTTGPRTDRAYVATSSHVKVVDTTSDSVIASIPVASGSEKIALDPAAGRVFVSNFHTGLVSVVDLATGAVVAINVAGPYSIAVGPAAAAGSVAVVPALSRPLLALLVLSMLGVGGIVERRRTCHSRTRLPAPKTGKIACF